MSDLHFLQIEILDILPNPVLVKDNQLRYVLVNKAFEELFNVRREDLIGELDKDVFKQRQAIQCNGGDLRVLESGDIDEAYETVFRANSEPRETITRKNRLICPNGKVFLVGIMHDITEVSLINRELERSQKLLQQQSEELKKMAHTDPLTGCSNRRAFSMNAPKSFEKYGNVGSLLILDLDHFKRINDTYGHDIGDLALIHVVNIVAQLIRKDDDLVRLGGEEFAIALPNASVEESRFMAERICKVVGSSPMFHAGRPLIITVSIGVVHAYEKRPFNLDAMLIKGDACLYKAKAAGRNCVVYDTCHELSVEFKREENEELLIHTTEHLAVISE
ncbi:sensor domain-containing diguanylate cyclase [Leptothoe sp. PORK10 BA2]|jgi:diguanylate cyclase (GGDEF)-like protein|uniref:sensor domain-containing diguanylate cyclase n=1 Tax=Leptothoe sp. PORK10 BA2 TaxID=3110254 RepID=UPI002B1FF6A9|nr:GGDEF domain-containing protein [Leptothoe sp. PORK10 BA2]MEA5466975.1 GGDEF domain-containing protein [Leptothoe sp. PORK10 BA2]